MRRPGRTTAGPAPVAHDGSIEWRSGRQVRMVGLLTGVAIVVAATVGIRVIVARRAEHASPVGTPARDGASAGTLWLRPVVSPQGLMERSGVRVVEVAVTAGGGLVDLRFQVVDPDKALSVHDPSTPPAVVDERSGLVVHDLLMGHAHGGSYQSGVTYYLIFENPGNLLKPGGRVSVLLGGAQVANVPVR